MNWLTAKVMQYIAGVLLIACIGLGAKGCALSTERDLAAAARDTAQANARTAITERESWKSKTADALAANAAYAVIFDKLQAEADAQLQRADAAAKQAAAAVAAARRDEAAAEKTLAAFRKRFEGKPVPCAAALLAMQNACPTLEGY